jgi:hypothetical protein
LNFPQQNNLQLNSSVLPPKSSDQLKEVDPQRKKARECKETTRENEPLEERSQCRKAETTGANAPKGEKRGR